MNYYDNSLIGYFFSNLKTETGYRGKFRTRLHRTYHNEKRIQLNLAGRSPKEYMAHMMRQGVA